MVLNSDIVGTGWKPVSRLRVTRRARRSILLAAGVLSCTAVAALRGDDWPTWRGPMGTGVVSDGSRAIPLEWSESRNVRWRAPLPDRGNSTPIVVGDRVFITQAIEKTNRRTVMCFARGDGRLLWQSGVTYAERDPTNGQNPYCSASPATDGRRVVAYFGSAGLFCFDAATGKELWRRGLGKVDSWQGSGSSPVIVGNLCIINAGPGTNAVLAACDLETGEIVWRVTPPRAEGGGARKPGEQAPPDARDPPRPPVGKFDDAMMAADPSGAGGYLGSWSTPMLLKSATRDELIVVHPLQLTGYDPPTGRELWTIKDLPEQSFASPTVNGDIVLALGRPVAGGGTRATAVRLTGRGAERLWQSHIHKECVGSPVIAGDHAYLATTFGSVVCLDMKTGKKVNEERLAGEGSRGGSWSSILLANGKLFVPNQSGEVFVLDANPKLAIRHINTANDEITCASLAASHGHVFLRTYQSLWCFAER